MAASDLGGLGAKDGPALAYTWTLPSMMPNVLPWVLLLVLLALKANRAFSAWLVFVPLGIILGMKTLLESAGVMDRGLVEFLSPVVGSMAFTLAAIWLISPYLVRKHRILTDLCLIPAVALLSVLFYAIRELWDNDWSSDIFAIIIGMLVVGFGLSLALALSGLVSRRRYRPVWFTVWFVVWLVVGIMSIVAPMIVIMTLVNGWPMSMSQVLTEISLGVASGVGANLLLILPFLLLSYRNGFFRERFKALFHLTEPASPPIAPPTMPAEAGIGGS